MAQINVSNAPFINQTFYVTCAFGQQTSEGIHKGLDLATSPSIPAPLYSVCNGTLIYKGTDISYGYYCILRDPDADLMFLYAHLERQTSIGIGETITRNQYISDSGDSGHAFGVHLHLQCQRGSTWRYSSDINDFVDPTTYLTGIINIASGSNAYFYDGTPSPPPTPTSKYNHKFPWFIYFRKRRINKQN